VIKVQDDDLRKLYREGKWKGISMGGRGQTEVVKAKEQEETISMNMLAKVFKALGFSAQGQDLEANNQETQEEEMRTEDVQKIVNGAIEENNKTLLGSIEKIVKGEDDVSSSPKVEFEGDINNPADLEKHKAKLMAAEVDMTDPEQVEKLLKQLKGDSGANEELEKANKALKEAQDNVARLEKKSNQSSNSHNSEPAEESDDDIIKEMVGMLNGRQSYRTQNRKGHN